MTKTKPVKLTAAQQEVVNLMADGWKLERHNGIGSGRGTCWMHKGKEERKDVRIDMGVMLSEKGVVDTWPSGWKSVIYTLNELGRTIAKPVEKPTLTTWYCTGGYRNTIEAVRVVAATEAFVTLESGRKDKIHSASYDYFPTREEAVEHVRKVLQGDVKTHEGRLKHAEAALAKFNETEG